MYDNHNNPNHQEPDMSSLHGQPFYPESYGQPGAASAPTKRRHTGGGWRGFVSLVLVAVISVTAGAGGAYMVLESYEFPEAAGAAPVDNSNNYVTNTANAGTGSLTGVVKKAAGSVVEIYTETMQANFFGQYITEGAGSGVIYSEDGYIITNNHVIEGARSIMVRTGDGTEYEATLIGTDEQTDLAVLKIDAKGLVPVTIANSDNIEVGEVAVVIGNPLGTLGGSVTSGIISAKDRQLTLDNQTMTLLQTSAAVNPGNSGGGLFNGGGDLIGIINAKSSGNSGGASIEGLGFAIPSNVVETVAEDIITRGYVTGRPYIGVSIREITDLRTAAMFGYDRLGIYVMEVTANNNLQAGDLIIAADGIEISTNAELSGILAGHVAGDVLEVEVVRDGKEITVSVPLAEKVPEHIREQIKAA